MKSILVKLALQVEVLGVSLFSGKIYCTMDQGLLGSGNGSSTSYRDSLTPGKTRRDSESLHRLTPPKSPSLTQIASRSSPNLATTGFDLLSDTFHPPPQGHSSSGVGSPLVSDLFSWDPFEATSAPSNSPSSSLHTLSGRAKTTHQQSTDDFLLRSGSEAKGPAERYVGLLETMLASTSVRACSQCCLFFVWSRAMYVRHIFADDWLRTCESRVGLSIFRKRQN